jgi:hypothetical protein
MASELRLVCAEPGLDYFSKSWPYALVHLGIAWPGGPRHFILRLPAFPSPCHCTVCFPADDADPIARLVHLDIIKGLTPDDAVGMHKKLQGHRALNGHLVCVLPQR